jgi:hypothetical protein
MTWRYAKIRHNQRADVYKGVLENVEDGEVTQTILMPYTFDQSLGNRNNFRQMVKREVKAVRDRLNTPDDEIDIEVE